MEASEPLINNSALSKKHAADKAKLRNILISEYPRLHLNNFFRAKPQAGLFKTFYGKEATCFYLGRGALWHGVKLLHLKNTDNVLVPSYHCGVDIESILMADVGITYYKVKEDMTVDMKDLQSKINSNSRAVLITHYYGFPQQIDSLKKFCQENKLFLIEDCAHALLSSYQGRPLGIFGDISIFSQRKSLALPDGGALLINHPNMGSLTMMKKPNHIVTLKTTIGLLFSSLGNANNCNVLINPLKFIKNKINDLIKKEFGKTYSTGMDFDVSVGHITMSNLSKRIMDGTEIEKVIQKRRQNFCYLLDNIANSHCIIKFYSALPEGTCPLFCPIQIIGKSRRDVQDFFLRYGVQTFVFGEILHSSLPKNTFAEAEMLSREILCLPVHQDLSKEDLDHMLAIMKSIY